MSRARMLAGALAAFALLLSACGDDGDSGSADNGDSTPAADALEGRGPIKLATGKDTSGNMQKLIDAWNEEHADEQVEIVELPESADDQRQQMVQNAEVESTEFTVLNLDVVWTAEFAANQWIVELPEDEFDLENFLEPATSTARYFDRLYAVPMFSDGGMLYYRKDLLDAAGVAEPPQTWQDMLDACAAVQATEEGADIGCYAGQFEKYEGLTVNFSEAINSAGGVVVDDQGKPNVNTPEAKAGVDFLIDAFDSGAIPEEAITYKEEEGRRAFQAGELLFHRQWPYQWSLANAEDGSSEVAGKFDVAPLPGKDGIGASTLGGHNFAISAFGENKATALDFIKYYASDEAQRSNLLATSQAPTRANLYDDAELLEQFPYLPTLRESILNAKQRPNVVRYGDVTAAIQESAYAALTGEQASDEALADLQTKLEELIQE